MLPAGQTFLERHAELAKVLRRAAEEVDEVVARLRQSPDPSRIEDDLHFLKGGALNLGFDAFGALCGAGERRAAGGDATSVDMGAILACYDDSKAMFLDWIGQQAVAA